MRWRMLLFAIAVSLVLSFLLSALFHVFVLFAFLPLLFIPLVAGARQRW